MMGQVIGMLASVSSKLLNGFSKGLASAGRTGATGAQQTGAVIIKKKAMAASAISLGLSVVGFVAWFAIVGAVWLLIPLVFGLLLMASQGLLNIIGGYLSAIQTHPRMQTGWRVLTILLKFVAVVLQAFIQHILLWIAAHLGLLLSMSALSFILIYGMERHLNLTVGIMDNIASLVVKAVNLGGLVVQILLELENFINPLVNMTIRGGVLVMIHVYDGIEYSIAKFGESQMHDRRMDEMGFSEAFYDTVGAFVILLLSIMNVYIFIATLVIDIFFWLGFAHILVGLLDVAAIIFTKLGCIIAGQWCSLVEVFHWLVNDILFTFFEIFCLNLCTIPDVQIGCTAGVLHEMGVPDECAGGVFVINPTQGWFSSLGQDGPRRRLGETPALTCVDRGGRYTESIHGTQVHSTHDRDSACPHTRAAFHPYGNSLNMARMDTHECYVVCARGVSFRVCDDHRTEFMGGCGTSRNVTLAEGSRRLDAFFGVETSLFMEGVVPANTASLMHRDDLARTLREHTGLQFEVGGIQCDLTRPQGSPFEALVDYACIAARVWSLHDGIERILPGGPEGRRLASPEPSVWGKAVREMLPYTREMRHSARLGRTYVEGYVHPTTPELHPLVHLQRAFTHVQKKRPSTKKLKPRRQLDRLLTCPPGQYLCADQTTCVDALLDCTTNTEYGLLGWAVYYLEQAIIFVNGVNMESFFSDAVQCWRGYKGHPEIDPLSYMSIYDTEEERNARCVWCFPMFPETDWEWTPIKFSLREHIYTSCIAVSDVFTGCHCPMFHEPQGAALPVFGEWVTLDLVQVIFNGLIVFKNTWIFVVGDGLGIVWSTVFPEPAFSPGLSRFFSLFSYAIPWEMYWLCNFIHLGSALATLLLFLLMLQLFRFSIAIFMFLVTGGMTFQERSQQWNYRWMEMGRVWHELLDTSGNVARLNAQVAALERVVYMEKKTY